MSGESGSSKPRGEKPSSIPFYLSRIAYASTPFITTFLLIHLSAPVLANVGGSSLASRAMLLGREYYQEPLRETFLVLTPVGIHVVSSILKRFTTAPSARRPWYSTLSYTAHLSLLIFIPIHYITHRGNPSIPDAPVYGVGPAELDYEFVKVGLQTWPLRSWILYTGLVAFTSIHVVEGVRTIWNTLYREYLTPPGPVTRRIILASMTVPVLLGLFALSQEPITAMSTLVGRYKEAFAQSLVYQI